MSQKMIERIAKGKTLRPLAMLAAVLLFAFAWLLGTEKRGSAATGTGDYISGAVTSSKGAEAGVWVVAETTDLPTKYVKIVVTDDRGRYVLPELPMATYQVFVRGYGLVDSPRVPAKPGQHLDLKAVVRRTRGRQRSFIPPITGTASQKSRAASSPRTISSER